MGTSYFRSRHKKRRCEKLETKHIIIIILLIIFCWPAAIIYVLMKKDEIFGKDS